MELKSFLVLCASALLVQCAHSQCAPGIAAPWALAGPGWNGFAGPAYANPGLAAPYGCGVASTGGGLPVSSASPIPPIGITIISENSYEGLLSAGGNLPFLGTVAIEGVLPTTGAGAVSYGCGNGDVGMATEGPVATGILAANTFAPAGYATGIPGIRYNGVAGLGGYGYGPGCGCGFY